MATSSTTGGGLTLGQAEKDYNAKNQEILNSNMSALDKRIAQKQAEKKFAADKAAADKAKKKKEEEEAAASASAEEEEEAVALFTEKSESIDKLQTELDALKTTKVESEDLIYAEGSDLETSTKNKEKVKILNERIQEKKEELEEEKEKGKTDWGKLSDIGKTAVNFAITGTILGSLLKGQPDVPTPPSAGETLGELGAVAAGTEYGINQAARECRSGLRNGSAAG